MLDLNRRIQRNGIPVLSKTVGIKLKGVKMPPRIRCPVLVLCCVDFRYIDPILAFVKKRFGIKACDMKTDPGGVKTLLDSKPDIRESIITNVKLIRERHDVRTLVLVNHQDCAAYGGSKRFSSPETEATFHAGQLLKARAILKSRCPSLDIQAFYAHKNHSTVAFKAITAQSPKL